MGIPRLKVELVVTRMNNEIDYAAFELGLATPRLRDDLQLSARHSKHGPFYVIEDETNSKF